LSWLEKHCLYSGIPRLGAGFIDPHYVYNQSLAQLLRGETEKFIWALYSLLAYGQSRDTYATIEGMNLVTGSNGDAWDANRQPHGHSNARVIGMVRIACLLEHEGALHVLAGQPRGWLEDGKTIRLRNMPTEFGTVGVSAVTDYHAREVRNRGSVWWTPGQLPQIDVQTTAGKAQPRVDYTLTGKWRGLPPKVVLHVRPPSRMGRIKRVEVGGKPWSDHDGETVRLPQVAPKSAVRVFF
jgi:hypothetical protein